MKIEKNRRVPKPNQGRKQRWEIVCQLEVNDSFFVSENELRKQRCTTQTLRQLHASLSARLAYFMKTVPGRVFSVRGYNNSGARENKAGHDGFRVWRLS